MAGMARSAEVAAALGVSHAKASSQMQLSLTLRDRLPRVAALYLDGRVSHRVISAIGWHTFLVQDHEALGLIDTALRGHAEKWGRHSNYQLAQAIDFWVDRHDPGALRHTRGLPSRRQPRARSQRRHPHRGRNLDSPRRATRHAHVGRARSTPTITASTTLRDSGPTRSLWVSWPSGCWTICR